MAWPRTKNSRSSALPGTHQHSAVQVTVTPAPDADPAPESGRNTGVSGTRHSVVDPPAGSRLDARPRHSDVGFDDEPAVEPDGTPDQTPDQTRAFGYDDDEPVDSGIDILGGMATTTVPGDAPTAPQPVVNEQIAEPRPVSEPPSRPAPAGPGFGVGYGGRPVASTGGQPRRVRDLGLDQRLRIWRWRLLIMVVVGVVSWLLFRNVPVAVTLVVLAGIIDTVYRARTIASIPTGGNPDRAQRHTRRQLAGLRRRGYLTLHARPIPDSREVIDHLVVGPTGVYAIDSEKWRKDFPIRTSKGKNLWHGPDTKTPRLEHAHWEAQQASQRLSAALGREIVVQPAMAVYGPAVPWDIATIRGVDVFSGPRLRKYFARRARKKDVKRLTPDEVREIFDAAGAVLPDVAPARRSVAQTGSATPVG
jgi:Nuclease-related domain